MNLKILIIFIYLFLLSCSNKTIYSGKIFDQETFDNLDFNNKETLLKQMGNPSFIDPIENKYFYYSEKTSKKSIFNKDTKYSYVFVFKFDENNKILNSKVFDLKNKKNIEIIEKQTSNEIVKRGLLEKFFGGIGAQKELPNSP